MPISKYQVTEAGYDKWVEIKEASPSAAGEEWVSKKWMPSDGPTTYELDVKDEAGNLYEVTVDVEVSVDISGYAQKSKAIL